MLRVPASFPRHSLRLAWLIVLGVTALAGSSHAAQTATATLQATAIQLLPSTAQFVTGYGNVTTFYSTFNGTSGALLIDTLHGGVVSGEIRPRSGSSTLFEGGYAQSTDVVVIDYGSYAVSIPTTDVDGNGLQDVLQFDQPGNYTATGSGYSVLGNTTFSISVKFTRAANQASGTYSATTTNSLNQSNTVSGVFQLSAYSGSVSYTRGATNTLSLTLTPRNPDARTLNGSTTYTSTGTSQLSYAAFTVHGSDGTQYQVNAGSLARTGRMYRGTLKAVDGLLDTYWADFTGYILEITDLNDNDNDGIPDLTDPDAILVAPTITGQPTAKTVAVGDTASFSISVSGSPTPTIQWRKDGIAISGASSTTLTLTSVASSAAGTYSAVATNSAGAVTSNNAVLSVVPAGTLTAPAITTQPVSHSLAIGATAVFSVVATGAETYQWKRNGTALLGATSSSLVLSNVQQANAANYTASVTNSKGTTNSNSAALLVVSTLDEGRVINASVRTTTGTGDNVLIVGFVVGGAGTSGNASLLVRGLGPRLGDFGVPDILLDPIIQIIAQGSSVIAAQNDNWGNAANIISIAQTLGALSLSATSKDSALVTSLAAGAYSVKVLGAGNTSGTTLAELYDAQPNSLGTGTPRVINISARAAMSNANPLIAGFVITGATAKTVLIRAIGPYLSQYFGASAMQNPKLDLYGKEGSADVLVATNDDWGGSSAASTMAQSLGAFALPDGASKDAVLLVTLQPGVYSAQVTSKDAGSGIALLEVYASP